MTADAITFASAARHNGRLAKVVRIQHGQIVAVEPAPQAGLHRFRSVHVGSLAEVMKAVQDAAERGEIAVRGEPLAHVGRRAIYPDAEKGPPGLEVVPRRWVAFDWDGLPIRPHEPTPALPEIADDPAEAWNWARPDPLLDPELGARECLRRLPPAFRDVTCGWQVSASGGYKLGWRLRTWHWFDHPCTGAELKTWLKPAVERNLVDPVTLLEPQPHYLAVTVRGGPDPCPRRFGLLRLAKDAVPVPDIARIKRWQQTRDRQPESRRWTAPSPGGPVEQRLEACVAAVRTAPDGTKHPTYYKEAARAKALCDRHGADWHHWRERLRQSYEASLPADEAKRRRKSSTLGVLEWVERRAG